MSSVRLKRHDKIPRNYGIHVHTASCFETYENKRAKIRGFILQIRSKITNLLTQIKHKFRFKSHETATQDVGKGQSHNRDLRGFS